MGDVAAGIVDVGLDQHGIARGLVDLDSVAVGQDFLELRSVEACGAAHQREARWIETELVLLQAVQNLSPVDARGQVVSKAAGRGNPLAPSCRRRAR